MTLSKINISKPSASLKDVFYVSRTLLSGWWGQGKEVIKFENKLKELFQTKNCITTNSCTSALQLCLQGLPKGSEVIIPSITFISTALPVLYNDLKIVLADVEEDTLNIDFSDVEKKITKKTSAIIVVHMGGNPANIEKLKAIKSKYKIRVIEDCAHAIGSYYKGKHVGNFGDYGCFSFHAIKNISTGDGGAIISKHNLSQLEIIKNLGINNITYKRNLKDYHQKYDVEEVGYKYYMNDISAALGLAQLPRLKKFNLKRQSIYKYYKKKLGNVENITFLRPLPQSKPSHHLTIIKLNSEKVRNNLKDYLNKKGISTGIHYKPLYNFSLFKDLQKTKIAEKVNKQILTLPNYPSLKRREQKYVCNQINKFFN